MHHYVSGRSYDAVATKTVAAKTADNGSNCLGSRTFHPCYFVPIKKTSLRNFRPRLLLR
jgi:hypothetical protein